MQTISTLAIVVLDCREIKIRFHTFCAHLAQLNYEALLIVVISEGKSPSIQVFSKQALLNQAALFSTGRCLEIWLQVNGKGISVHEITAGHRSLSGMISCVTDRIRFLPVTMTSRFSNFNSISYTEDQHELRATNTNCRLPDTMSSTDEIFISGAGLYGFSQNFVR